MHLAIDWSADVLACFFDDGQWSRIVSDPSLARCREESLSPTNLTQCMRDFTKEETIAGDDLPYCSKCKDFHEATKQIELWRLPPVLIVHLKRFRQDARCVHHRLALAQSQHRC